MEIIGLVVLGVIIAIDWLAAEAMYEIAVMKGHPWWDYFEVNYAEQALEPDTEHHGIGDFYIELTEKDTLLVTLKRNDGAVDTCEYQRVN